MDETQMMHGVDWDGSQDVTGWYASEKMDGCRAYWDGQQFWTRGGQVVSTVPFRIVRNMPQGIQLDGEFWAGRGQFLQKARVAVQHGVWTPEVRFVAFDAPALPGDIQARLAAARDLAYPHGEVVRLYPIRNRQDVVSRFHSVIQQGGEGIMLHRPGVPYRIGRSSDLLKVKTLPFNL